MVYLLFEIGHDLYALDACQVVEVLPLVEFKQIPGAISGLTGLFNYRGKAIPLLDLTELSMEKPSLRRMSTRIIVTNYVEASGEHHLIGLLAERVTETIRQSEAEFNDPGVSAASGARFLGPVLIEGGRIIQRVKVEHVLPENLRAQLFAELIGS